MKVNKRVPQAIEVIDKGQRRRRTSLSVLCKPSVCFRPKNQTLILPTCTLEWILLAEHSWRYAKSNVQLTGTCLTPWRYVKKYFEKRTKGIGVQWCSRGIFSRQRQGPRQNYRGRGSGSWEPGNEARRDWGRGIHPEAKASQMETDA